MKHKLIRKNSYLKLALIVSFIFHISSLKITHDQIIYKLGTNYVGSPDSINTENCAYSIPKPSVEQPINPVPVQ